MEIGLSTNATELLREWRRLPDRLQGGVRRGLQRGLIVAETHVRQMTGVQARRGAAGLMGRLTSHVADAGGALGIDGVIGFRRSRGFPYEMSQEFGAKAKPGKAMAIPITPAARSAGSPRNFPKKLVIPGGRGNATVKAYSGRTVGILAEVTAKGLLRPHYILVKSIEPRLKFRETLLSRRTLAAISREVEMGAEAS